MKWAVYSRFKNESKNHTDLWLLQENEALPISFEACGEFILLTLALVLVKLRQIKSRPSLKT